MFGSGSFLLMFNGGKRLGSGGTNDIEMENELALPTIEPKVKLGSGRIGRERPAPKGRGRRPAPSRLRVPDSTPSSNASSDSCDVRGNNTYRYDAE